MLLYFRHSDSASAFTLLICFSASDNKIKIMWFLIKDFEHVRHIQYLNVKMNAHLAQIRLAKLTESIFLNKRVEQMTGAKRSVKMAGKFAFTLAWTNALSIFFEIDHGISRSYCEFNVHDIKWPSFCGQEIGASKRKITKVRNCSWNHLSSSLLLILLPFSYPTYHDYLTKTHVWNHAW